MGSEPVKIPSYFIDFMDSVILNGHDSIIMRANARAADDTCVELDVRLHDTKPDLRFSVGLIDENAYFDHPETGEALADNVKFRELLGLPVDTPAVDGFYLGPFSEQMVLEIMAAADHTAARLDNDRYVSYLQKQLEDAQNRSHAYQELSEKRGSLVTKLGELEQAYKREERKGMFTVIEGGKPKVPAAG